MDTLTIVLTPELRALALQAFQEEAAAYYRQLPKPDQQFTLQEVAKILSLSDSTVRTYIDLPVGHPRRLAHVVCTDSDRGRRIRLTEIQAWQHRNTFDVLEAAAIQAIVDAANRRRPARRRPRPTT